MTANGVTIPRERVLVSEAGAEIPLPMHGVTVRLSLDDLHDLRIAVEAAGLAAHEDAALPVALFSTSEQEGED